MALHRKHAWVICKRREQAIGTSDHVHSSSYLPSLARLVITNEGQYIELLGGDIFWVVIGIRQGGWGYAADSEFDKARLVAPDVGYRVQEEMSEMGRITEGGHGLKNFIPLIVVVSMATLLLSACGPPEPTASPPEEEQVREDEEPLAPERIEMKITSQAFRDGGTIPVKYTCYGEDISPELRWSGAPERTQSFALIVDDPHTPVGTLTYWVIFNIPSDMFELAEGVPTTPELSSGALQGRNDFGMTRYGGVCPLWDTPHHYHFVLYALDQTLDLPAGASRVQVVNAMQDHILAQADLAVTYNR